jgi:hypothetical protein
MKPEYSKYTQRLLKGLLRAILVSVIMTILLLWGDIGKVGVLVLGGLFGTLSLVLIISVIKKSKKYLFEIRQDGEDWEFEMYEYDKPKEVIKSKISETRILIWEVFFPFIKVGRNYMLVIETKQGLTYRRVIQQSEIGNWNLDRFKEVMKLYGESKGVPVSTASYTRDNISTNKD